MEKSNYAYDKKYAKQLVDEVKAGTCSFFTFGASIGVPINELNNWTVHYSEFRDAVSLALMHEAKRLDDLIAFKIAEDNVQQAMFYQKKAEQVNEQIAKLYEAGLRQLLNDDENNLQFAIDRKADFIEYLKDIIANENI